MDERTQRQRAHLTVVGANDNREAQEELAASASRMAASTVRGEQREAFVSRLKQQLPTIRRAWMQGRFMSESLMCLQDGALSHRTNHEEISRFIWSMHENLNAQCEQLFAMYPTSIERIAFAVGANDWEADVVADDDMWLVAWLQIADQEGIAETVALEVLDVNIDTFRRTRRRARQRADEDPASCSPAEARLLTTGKQPFGRLVKMRRQPWRYP